MWRSILSAIQQAVQPRGEGLALLVVPLHKAWILGQFLDSGEQCTFFSIMVVLERFHPCSAEEWEVADVCWRADIWCLEVDTVEAVDQGIVDVGNF